VAPLPDLILYARPGCSLCEEAWEAIHLVLEERRSRDLAIPSVVERNIDADPELQRRLLERIPVAEIGDQRVELVVTVGKLRRMLASTLDEATAGA
jgi:hypothetical protein